ncbi:hypothetical protein CFBP4996_28160 (plasmid) [Agrobacterium leguminum]|uniref:hypothetical protein n=1 Tax=Agrobacterium leguminum TaxID=2792015 RepID=UPI0011043AEA|nr:hypothetical protein [Agrobacterium leguminum]WFS69620.1 hypothetical protein CFBP4996_28160 [Agrobacterium leguminum]
MNRVGAGDVVGSAGSFAPIAFSRPFNKYRPSPIRQSISIILLLLRRSQEPHGLSPTWNKISTFEKTMDQFVILAFLIKMAISAFVVVIAAAAVERSGPFVGAMITTLPLSAGPAFAFLALDHGSAFLASAAMSSLAGTAATAIFITVYCRLAKQPKLLLNLVPALLAWGVIAWSISLVPTNPVILVAVNITAFAAAFILTRDFRRGSEINLASKRWWDVPVRSCGVMALVGLVLLAGHLFGSKVSGVLALAPIVMTSLVVILQRRLSSRAAAQMLAHALPGMAGFSVATVVLGFSAVPFGAPVALLFLLLLSVVWNLTLVTLRHTF